MIVLIFIILYQTIYIIYCECIQTIVLLFNMVVKINLLIIIWQIIVINKNSKSEDVFVDKIKDFLIP